MAPGTELLVVRVGELGVGFATCYDVRFPGLFTALAERGAQLICVPASWGAGPGKVEQWQLLLRARALDCTSYVAAAGQADPTTVGAPAIGRRRPGSATAGWSARTEPLLAALGAEPGRLVVDIEPEVVAATRRADPGAGEPPDLSVDSRPSALRTRSSRFDRMSPMSTWGRADRPRPPVRRRALVAVPRAGLAGAARVADLGPVSPDWAPAAGPPPRLAAVPGHRPGGVPDRRRLLRRGPVRRARLSPAAPGLRPRGRRGAVHRVGRSGSGTTEGAAQLVTESARFTGAAQLTALDFTFGSQGARQPRRTTTCPAPRSGAPPPPRSAIPTSSQQLVRVYRADAAVELVGESGPEVAHVYRPALVELPADVAPGTHLDRRGLGRGHPRLSQRVPGRGR